jgi:hypothetical protein
MVDNVQMAYASLLGPIPKPSTNGAAPSRSLLGAAEDPQDQRIAALSVRKRAGSNLDDDWT